jgi:hypothetical protein
LAHPAFWIDKPADVAVDQYYVDNVVVDSLGETPSSKTTTNGGSTQGGSGTTSSVGTLSISDDQGNIYVNGRYYGKGSVVLSVYPGTYSVYATSPSDGSTCWQTSATVTAGKTTAVRMSTYCR